MRKPSKRSGLSSSKQNLHITSRDASVEETNAESSRVDLQATTKLYTSKKKESAKRSMKRYRSKKDSILNTKKRNPSNSYYAM